MAQIVIEIPDAEVSLVCAAYSAKLGVPAPDVPCLDCVTAQIHIDVANVTRAYHAALAAAAAADAAPTLSGKLSPDAAAEALDALRERMTPPPPEAPAPADEPPAEATP